MKFQLYRDSAGQYRWRLVAANGRVIADSGESYYNKTDCLAAIQLVKQWAPTAPVEDLTDSGLAARRW